MTMDKAGHKADLGQRSKTGGKAKWTTVMVYMAGDKNLDGRR